MESAYTRQVRECAVRAKDKESKYTRVRINKRQAQNKQLFRTGTWNQITGKSGVKDKSGKSSRNTAKRMAAVVRSERLASYCALGSQGLNNRRFRGGAQVRERARCEESSRNKESPMEKRLFGGLEEKEHGPDAQDMEVRKPGKE